MSASQSDVLKYLSACSQLRTFVLEMFVDCFLDDYSTPMPASQSPIPRIIHSWLTGIVPDAITIVKLRLGIDDGWHDNVRAQLDAIQAQHWRAMADSLALMPNLTSVSLQLTGRGDDEERYMWDVGHAVQWLQAVKHAFAQRTEQWVMENGTSQMPFGCVPHAHGIQTRFRAPT